MKKFIAFISALTICIASALPVMAEFTNPPVTDNAGYLTEEEFSKLSENLERIRQLYDFDVDIYTESTMDADSAQDAADDIFDYQGYGAGEDADGILLYVATEPRVYHFSTHGLGMAYFNSSGLSHVEEEVLPYLKENDYYTAFTVYADKAEELLQMASEGEPYDESQSSGLYTLCVVAGALLLPLIIAYAAMHFKLSLMNTAVNENFAENYIKENSYNLTNSQDIYLYSRIDKVERPKEDSSSDCHTSSSGETHGGTGGSY